jgi:hypothetical protein
MRSILVPCALGALACLAAPPSRAQDIICCMTLIKANGDWFGAIRPDSCQDFFDRAPPPQLETLCSQRDWLNCIDTSRCATLPPRPDRPPAKDTGSTASLPPATDPNRDGVADGFGPAPSAPPSSVPPAGGVSPPRLAYIVVARSSAGGPPLVAFTVYLDRAACAVPLADDGQPAKGAAPVHVVRGRIVREAGRVRVQAEASPVGGGGVSARGTGEAAGDDRAAVAAATRQAARAMKLACAR